MIAAFGDAPAAPAGPVLRSAARAQVPRSREPVPASIPSMLSPFGFQGLTPAQNLNFWLKREAQVSEKVCKPDRQISADTRGRGGFPIQLASKLSVVGFDFVEHIDQEPDGPFKAFLAFRRGRHTAHREIDDLLCIVDAHFIPLKMKREALGVWAAQRLTWQQAVTRVRVKPR